MLFCLKAFSFYVNLLSFSLLIVVHSFEDSSGFNNIKISTDNALIYEKSEIQSNFDYNSQLKYSCIVPVVLEDDENVDSRIIKIENQMSCDTCVASFALKQLSINVDHKVLRVNHNFTNISTLQIGDSLYIKINYKCYEGNSNAWSLLTFNLMFLENKNLSFSYVKICNSENLNAGFDYSLLILAGISLLILGISSHINSLVYFKNDNEKYELSIYFAVLYSLAYSISILLIYYFGDIAIIVFIVIFGILSLVSIFVILLELMEFLPKFLKCKLGFSCSGLNNISIGSVIMAAGSIAIVLCWAFFRNFVLDDICAYSIVILAVKVIRVNSIKMATVWITLIMLFELMWGFLFVYPLENSYQTFFSSEFCLPLRIIIPTFKDFLHLKCSWLPISSVIFPGLTLQYLHKYDKSKNIHIYFRTGVFFSVIGAAIWIIVLVFSKESIPWSFFSFPLIIVSILVLSYLRNEHTELWEGSFFDGSSLGQSQESGGALKSFKSLKSLNSNYNKEEVFEGLLSKKGSRMVEGNKILTFDSNKINNDDSSNLQE